MEYNKKKVDEAVLALLHLTTFTEGSSLRAWKGLHWDSLNRLFERGLIGNPRSKAKSVTVSDEGARQSEELFRKYFTDNP